MKKACFFEQYPEFATAGMLLRINELCYYATFLSLTVNPQVPGSSPGRGAKDFNVLQDCVFSVSQKRKKNVRTPCDTSERWSADK